MHQESPKSTVGIPKIEPSEERVLREKGVLDPSTADRGLARGRWIGAMVLALGLGGMGALYGQFTKSVEKTPVSSQPPLLPVSTLSAEPVRSYTVERFFTGEIQARRTSELGFERSGELISVQVEEGDWVETGHLLAQLDTRTLEARRQQIVAQYDQARARLQELQMGPRPEQIEVARAAVADLEEQLTLSRLQQQRREDLYREGAISREQLDEVAFAAEGSAERLRGAQSQLEELLAGTRVEQIAAQRAQVDQLQAQRGEIDVELSKSRLLAPFSGRIGARRLDEGTVAGVGQSILRLVEDRNLEARIGIPTAAIASLQVGDQQQIWVEGSAYTAEVTGMLPEVEDPTRTVTVILTLPPGSAVTVGQTARLQLLEMIEVGSAEGSSSQHFWVPTTALVPSARGLWSVYTLRPADATVETVPVSASPTSDAFQVARQEVEILHTQENQVLVRGTLEAGDRVIDDGVQRIVSGQWVTMAPI